MRIDVAHGFEKLGKVAERLVSGSSKAKNLLDDATLQIGMASDSKYGIPAFAMQAPTFVGDHAMIGKMVGKTPKLDAMYKRDPSSVSIRPVFNGQTGKYDMVVKESGLHMTQDTGELLAMQTIAPWNASFFPEYYRQPLLYSHARDLVKRKGATNPWGEVQNLALAAYSGWAAVDGAGTVGANLKKNVNVQGGMMTNPIINIKIFFNLTIEEIQRATDGNGSPFAGSLMAEKQRYAQYVIDMVTDYLTYNGNAATNTPGLFDVSGITTWTGPTLDYIAGDSGNAAKGSTMYSMIAGMVKSFMDDSHNKFDIIKIAMAPQTYNRLAATQYSDVYNPKSTLAIFEENFEAGVTKGGSKPRIEFYSDPLLEAGMYSDGCDRFVITAPEVGAGPDDEKQDILLLGVPLENFVYPVNPNGYDQQHATLRRFAGVFAPVASAVKVYAGVGTQPVEKLADPEFSVAAGTYGSAQSVTISGPDGADIYYTTDGSTPSEVTGVKYTSAVTISENKTLKAIAVRYGYDDSDVTSAAYVIKCATPVAAPAAGAVLADTEVALTTATVGADIYYTTNGDTPTAESTKYTTAIVIDASKTVKAIAIKDGMGNSDVLTAAYTVG